MICTTVQLIIYKRPVDTDTCTYRRNQIQPFGIWSFLTLLKLQRLLKTMIVIIMRIDDCNILKIMYALVCMCVLYY